MFKKLVILSTALFVGLSNYTTAFAVENFAAKNTELSEYSEVIYEREENLYDSILNQTSREEAFSMSSEKQMQISEAINNLKDSIYLLKEKSTEELKSIGYSGTQLYAIQNYDGSEAMTRASVPTIYSSAQHSISGNYYTVRASFEYVGTYTGYLNVNNNYGITTFPLLNGNGVTPGTPNTYSSSITYNYYINSQKYTTTRSATTVDKQKGACMFSFPVGVDISNTRAYVSSGTFTMQCRVAAGLNQVKGYCGYLYITADRKSDFLGTAASAAYSIFTNDYIGLILSFIGYQNDTALLAGVYW